MCVCVDMHVYCTLCGCAWFPYAAGPCVCFFLINGLPHLMCWWLCVCVLLSRENLQVRIRKANMTFWAHLNCCFCGWRRMMSLPKLLRKPPVVWRCPCHTFLLLISASVCRNCTPSCVCACVCLCMTWVTTAGRRGCSRSPEGCCGSHFFTWLPQASFLSSPLPKHKNGAKYCAVQEQRARQDCKPVNIMLYSYTYSALTHDESQKTSSKAHLCLWIAAFVENYCSCSRTVTPLLTNVLLWIPGADIVQWLMKNLSIEDPGKPAEKSVITCKHNRAQLKRKAISNHPPQPLHVCAFSHVNSWSHPPWESGRRPWLHLPHLRPCANT